MFGAGLRSLEQLSPAAFSATVCRTIPRMIEARSLLGESETGFMPALVSLLGAGSFDDATDARWFTHLVASGARLGREFASAWQDMQRE
eukprot:1189605-Karenia_brevis.AAC.1